jgi:hypothetical protein
MEPEITEMAALAASFVNSTNRHVFLTGKAGTGKTTFLAQLAQQTHKRFVILAPTGIAALNAKGVTLHSQFSLPLTSFIPERLAPPDAHQVGNFCDRDTLTRQHALKGMRRDVLREVDLLIIDEVSMLRADVLDAVDYRMRTVKNRYDVSFGGAQVLLIGDLYQLPPIVKDNEWQVLGHYYASPHFFSAQALQPNDDGTRAYVHIELDKIFRQRDERFIAILNNFRNNKVTTADLAALNKHYRSDDEIESKGVITLTTHNNKADALNYDALIKLPGPPRIYDAQIDGDFPEGMYPLPKRLELRVGAQVMFTRNDIEKEYFNGRLARITRIATDSVEVAMADNGALYVLARVVWENKRYAFHSETQTLNEEIIGTFTHYPIKLAWAITVHKSQGLTFDKAIIDVGSAFAPGQVYVALSRLRSLDGLILRTRISANVVRSDQAVVAFTARKDAQTQLPVLLKEQQRMYLRDLFANTFSLATLLTAADTAREKVAEASFADPAILQSLADVVDSLRGELDNTDKFRKQLHRLASRDDPATLLDRVNKGSEYYTNLLLRHLYNVLRTIGALGRLPRTTAYREALNELDVLLMKKLVDIGKAAHVAHCILSRTEVTRNATLDDKLKEQRTTLLARVNEYLTEHRSPGKRHNKSKSGRTRKKKRSTQSDS